MAIDFPDSPSDNDIYTVNGKRWIYSSGKWSIYGSTAPDATASDTEPTGVGDGHIWYRSDQSQTLIRYDNTWVEIGSAGGFDNASTNFPTSLDSATGFAAVEALQAKVGVNSSAVTTSLDYKVAQLESDVAGFTSGKILQVVSTTKTDTFSSTNNQVWTDVTGLSASITPSSVSSKILVLASVPFAYDVAASQIGAVGITRDSTDALQPDSYGNRIPAFIAHNYNPITSDNTSMLPATINFMDEPASTSSLTYQIRVISTNGSGTVYVNRSVNDADDDRYTRGIATLTLLEIAG
jgi:hypothetical protein